MKHTTICSYRNTKPKKAIATERALGYGCDACQYVLNEVLHTCSDFIAIRGKNPQDDGEEFTDDYRCSRAWIPILMIENSMQSHSIAVAVESMRNETVDRQDTLLHVVAGVKPPLTKQLEDDTNG